MIIGCSFLDEWILPFLILVHFFNFFKGYFKTLDLEVALRDAMINVEREAYTAV